MIKFVFNAFIVSLLFLCFSSCNNKEQAFSFSVSENSIDISTSDVEKENTLRVNRVHYKANKSNLGSEATRTFHFKQNCSLEILDLIKEEASFYEVALQLVENNEIAYHITINNTIDTILTVKPKVKKNDNSEKFAYVSKGACAKFETKENEGKNLSNIKSWLYDNNIQKNDSIIKKISYIASQLDSNSFVVYDTFEEIPVIKDFSRLSYNIKTNINADYYYLFATNNEQELNDFIKEVCVTNFEGGNDNLNQTLNCYRLKDKSGILCIFFIGVNKDWSKEVLPLGLIAVDNIPPFVFSDTDDDTSSLEKRHSIIESLKYQHILVGDFWINIPENAPLIQGFMYIATNMFRGNTANFQLGFSGDVQSISIKREIHRSYMRYSLKPETKLITLENKKPPYHFTYELDLGIGDNYIPIKVVDKIGNVAEYSYKISMVQVENDNPQINVDNNIDIWN